MSSQRNISLSMESPIYAVPELTRIVRVVGDHVSIKVRFNFIHESIAEMALLSCARDFLLMRFKYQQRTFDINNIWGHTRCRGFNFYGFLSDRCAFVK